MGASRHFTHTTFRETHEAILMRSNADSSLLSLDACSVTCHRNGGGKKPQQQQIYRPVLAASNRLLQKKWDQMAKQRHEMHLSKVKPMIDFSSPREVTHLKNKCKMKQMRREKLANMSHDDNILFEKIRRIERRKPVYFDIEDKTRNRVTGNSLNLPLKKQIKRKIELENMKIFKRLNAIKPVICREDHLKSFAVQSKRRLSISLAK